jgi:hypothetical protein
MITLSKVSKWYPNFQVLKPLLDGGRQGRSRGRVRSVGLLASRRSSNASMGSSRFRKAPSRSPAFPSATARPDLPKLRARRPKMGTWSA